MNREKIEQLLQEAGMMMEGNEDEAFIGAYFTAPNGKVKISVAEGGDIPAMTFLIARIILCVSATHDIKPAHMMRLVKGAFKLMLKYHKRGLPIGEFETRDLGIH